MASTLVKRDHEPDKETESESKKTRNDDTAESDSPRLPSQQAKKRVFLNPADCNLDINIQNDGLKGSDLYDHGFAYCWSGARANFGITGGKYCFSCKVISTQPVKMEDTPPDEQHVCLVGISRGDVAVGKLGETRHSFAFGGIGKLPEDGDFLDCGEKFGFGVGDTIVCAVDLERKPASIRFYKNGKWSGYGRYFDAGPRGLEVVKSPMKQPPWKSAVFPHVLLKNVVVEFQFSVEDGLVPVSGYKPWDSALDDGKTIPGPVLSDMRDCEVMLMVGLPASGKSTWAERWAKEHPEKRFLLLGTNPVLDQMKVPSFINTYGEPYDRLMSQANAVCDVLLSRAAKIPGNYIIDQNNVFKNARKRKLGPFANFRKIAVVVFPRPEELDLRADKRFLTILREVPADAVKHTLANYALPMSMDMPDSDECFDQVIFPGLNEAESKKYLEDMKHALKDDSTPYARENYRSSRCGRSSRTDSSGCSGTVNSVV